MDRVLRASVWIEASFAAMLFRMKIAEIAKVVAFMGLALLVAVGASAQMSSDNVDVSLMSEYREVSPNTSFYVALRQRIRSGWHTYWMNPGDSGRATRIRWELPEGFRAGPIEWPRPVAFDFEGLRSYGYEGEVVLPVRIDVPAGLRPGSTYELRAAVDWLECAHVCIPGRADLSLNLRIADGPAREQRRQGAAIRDGLAAVPRGQDGEGLYSVSDGVVTMSKGEGRYRQVVVVPEGAPEYDEAREQAEAAADRG